MPIGAPNLPSSRPVVTPVRLSLPGLRWVFIATILVASLITLVQATGVKGGTANAHVAALASIEIAAILAFSVERWRPLAALVLLLVFAIAFVVSALAGEFAARFIYFAASTIFLQDADRGSHQEPQHG